MILGDSLLVMNSLVEREAMRGKVQCIYMDPPYGIKFGSNFQPRIDQRDVKDGKDEDLTREVMQVQAFRDTWELGVHSYLTYLRDRLLVARELLSESGSIFVQIGDENVHRVRCLMDEVFGEENFQGLIVVNKTSGLGSEGLQLTHDFICWFSKGTAKFRRVYADKLDSAVFASHYETDEQGRPFTDADLSAQDNNVASCKYDFAHAGGTYPTPKGRQWKTTKEGMMRCQAAGRLFTMGRGLRFRRYLEDFPVVEVTDNWYDISGSVQSRSDPKVYAVQTSTSIVARCILMTTDPGDLVLDPTCGSGTTAFVAEQWGRRWITCDTSRVALAIARHRVMTAAFDYYTLRHPGSGVSGGFKYKTVPHITLKSIAQNREIDEIVERFADDLAEALARLDSETGRNWQHWEVPRTWDEDQELLDEITADISIDGMEYEDEDLQKLATMEPYVNALEHYWALRENQQRQIDASIQRNAPQEELVDQPEKERGIVRVSGPFTMEAVPNVAEISVNVEEKITDDLQMMFFEPVQPSLSAVNVNAYIGDMIERLRKSGVNVRGKETFTIENLRPVASEHIHAEGDILIRNGEDKRLACAVVIGPPNGAISEVHVRDAVTISRQWDAVLFCGYEFSDAAQEMIREHAPPGKKFYMSYINADTAMGDLLKDSKASQIFTMVGEPDVRVYRFGETSPLPDESRGEGAGGEGLRERFASLREGEMFIELRGVDLYDPLTGEVSSDSGRNVHAVFIDHDYDGKSFCICQALFPNKKDSWDKIARNLRGAVDEEAFEAFRTTVSLPFRPGANGKVQVKVIDARGNAIVKTVKV